MNDIDPDLDTTEQRVARGVTFLEQAVGKDWREFIDLVTFDISDPERCVIGQTFCHELVRGRVIASSGNSASAWQNGTWALHDYAEAETPDLIDEYDTQAPAELFGFERDARIGSVDYDDLEREWRRVITAS